MLNILDSGEKHNLASIRELYGFEKGSMMADIEAKLDKENLILTICVGYNGKMIKKNVNLNMSNAVTTFWEDVETMEQ